MARPLGVRDSRFVAPDAVSDLGTTGDQSLRTIAERHIIDLLLVGGWAYEMRDGSSRQAIEATQVALAGWVARGLPVRTDGAGSRFYDPVEVLNFMKWSSLSQADPFWTERFAPTGRRFLHDHGVVWPAPATTGPIAALPARRFSVNFRRGCIRKPH